MIKYSPKTSANGKTSILILSLLILMLVPTVSANDWTQYTPNVITNPSELITKIKTYPVYAMAYTNQNNTYFYNGSTWKQITAPTLNKIPQLATNTQVDFDKAGDGNFYWRYFNNSLFMETYQYNPETQIWTLIKDRQEDNGVGNGMTSGLSCLKESGTANCYYLAIIGTQLTPRDALTETNKTTLSLNTANHWLEAGNTEVYIARLGAIYAYNGVSWNIITPIMNGVATMNSLNNFVESKDSDYKAICAFVTGSGYKKLQKYGSVNGTFDKNATPTCVDNVLAIDPIQKDIFFGNDSGYISRIGYTSSTAWTSEPIPATSVDFDHDVRRGWLGSNNQFFYYSGSGAVGTTSSVPPNATTYNLAHYYNQNNNVTSILAVTPITSTKTYALARTSNNLTIISYDVSTPTSMIINELVTPYNKQPRSMDSLGDTILLGTNNNAILYNNTSPEDVTILNEQATIQKGAISDDLTSVYYTTGDLAYACDSFFTGDIIKYNITSGITITSVGEKCRDISSDSSGSTLYFWEGTSGLKIKDENLTSLSTINDITSVPNNNPTDSLSLYGNNLAVITGRNIIKIYDITNPTTPILNWECRVQNDISAIEMLDENKIIIATETPSIGVCNKNDSSLYDSTNNYYVAKILTSVNVGNVRDIRRNADGLSFSTAETDRYGYYSLTTGTLATTNIAPVISSIILNKNPICTNETVNGIVNAYDQDTPLQLYYSITCTGATSQSYSSTSGEFACSWQNAGTKSIQVTAHDNDNTVNNPISVTVQNCVNNNFLNFQIRDYDHPENLISGVLVNVLGQTSALSNNAGYASFNLPTAGIYNVSFSKTRYYDDTKEVQTGDGIRTLYLKSKNIVDNSTGQLVGRTTLSVLVKEEGTNKILPNALVSATNPIGGASVQTYSDLTGTANLIDVSSGVNLIVSASLTGYATRFTNIILSKGETKTLILLLNKEGYLNASSGRNCQDYLKGFLLCSPLNTSGNGDYCTTDNDCIGGRCSLSAGAVRTCSQLNYTYCDERGFDRGTWCMINQGITRGGEKSSNWILDHLLYVLAFLIILGIILFAVGRKR